MTPFDECDLGLSIEMFTDPEVRRHAGGIIKEDVIREQIPNWVRRGGNGCIGIWSVSDTGSGEKLGSVALLPMPIEEDDTDFELVVPGEMPDGDVEIGYFLKRSAWGKGYATEACTRLLRMAFEESPLAEVVATFDEGNDASRNVLLKTGFVDKGMRRCYGEEGIDFRLTRDAWKRWRQSA
ncbi:MAG: GNAT family N-acetyltransferase [Woeseiaceae bacterium]